MIVPVAPWEGYRGYEKEMKRAIMELANVIKCVYVCVNRTKG